MKRKLCPARRAANRSIARTPGCPYISLRLRHTIHFLYSESSGIRIGKISRTMLKETRVWLRAHCDFLTEKARFSYSTDGKKFEPLGDEFTMIFQLKTFQGVRYSLFHYHTGAGGGYADFDKLTVDEPHPRGLMKIDLLAKLPKMSRACSMKGNVKRKVFP
jgi:xylan 1,4-beta-xylosidase